MRWEDSSHATAGPSRQRHPQICGLLAKKSVRVEYGQRLASLPFCTTAVAEMGTYSGVDRVEDRWREQVGMGEMEVRCDAEQSRWEEDARERPSSLKHEA